MRHVADDVRGLVGHLRVPNPLPAFFPRTKFFGKTWSGSLPGATAGFWQSTLVHRMSPRS